ncbi:hypothetical protein Osc1_03700 [Hominimerdicola sp. 21CYCFAH17_S]
MQYFQTDVSELVEIMPALDRIDILIFPKSICEISSSDLQYIAKYISSKTDEIYIMASYRNVEAALNLDVNKMILLSNYLNKEKFQISIGVPEYSYSFEHKGTGIRKIYYDYVYPDEAISYIEQLGNKCILFDEDDNDCISCNDIITRKPILTLSNIHFNWLKFERY